MQIIEIVALEDGAHRNQTYHGTLPEGWVFVANEAELENFPFGSFEIKYTAGGPFVDETTWIAGEMPVAPEPETEPDVWDELEAAYREGVNGI